MRMSERKRILLLRHEKIGRQQDHTRQGDRFHHLVPQAIE